MKKFILMMSLGVAACVGANSSVKGAMSLPLLTGGGGRVYLVTPDGQTVWDLSGCGNVHRVWQHGGYVYWANGDIWRADIVTKKRERIYSPCEKEGVYGFDLLKNGNLVVAENGTDYIAELAAGTWKPIVRFKGNPARADGKVPGGPHHHYRMIRKTPTGTYLVCCSSANIVREYDKTGKLVWELPVPGLAFDALRRKNGNTVVGHLGAVTEYAADKSVVWQFKVEDAPDLKLANLCGVFEESTGWSDTGNLVIGTYANGVEDGSRTTVLCVNRAKKVVWSYAAAGKRFSNMCAMPVPSWRWPVGCIPVTPQDEVKMEDLVGTKLAATPIRPRKVLMVARAFGFSHNDALTYGNRAFAIAARKTGAFTVDFSEDIGVLCDPARLAAYDAVVLNNCTSIGARAFPELARTLTAYVKGGKGLCLIHAAVDGFYDMPEVADMNGGLFWGHPWSAGGKWLFRNEEPDHPLMTMFKEEPRSFVRSDEIYMHASPAYSRTKDRVLISMDLSDSATAAAADKWAKSRGADKLRADRDFAVSWTRKYGEGRVFYTSFGHDRRAFLDKARLLHMLAGLQYCLGDLTCPDAPRP